MSDGAPRGEKPLPSRENMPSGQGEVGSRYQRLAARTRSTEGVSQEPAPGEIADGGIDMSKWTAEERVYYRMNGVVPSRFNRPLERQKTNDRADRQTVDSDVTSVKAQMAAKQRAKRSGF